MALSDALKEHATKAGRRRIGCRICDMLPEMPEQDRADLETWFRTRASGPRPIADALAAEGYGDDLYNAVRHHMYVCKASQ